MKDWKLTIVGALGLLLVGCGDGDMKRFVELDTLKAQAYKDGGDDCDKVAKSYADWKGKYGKEYKDLQSKLKDKFKDKADADKALGSDKDKMEENKKVVIGAMMKCIDNEAYKKAVDAE